MYNCSTKSTSLQLVPVKCKFFNTTIHIGISLWYMHVAYFVLITRRACILLPANYFAMAFYPYMHCVSFMYRWKFRGG